MPRFLILLGMVLVVSSLLPSATAGTFCWYASSHGNQSLDQAFDVKRYNADLRLNVSNKSISGFVDIEFSSLVAQLHDLTLDADRLVIESVTDAGSAQPFEVQDKALVIHLTRPVELNSVRTVRVNYHATPTGGVRFFPDHVYAFYATPRWLVCHFDPVDRAVLNLKLTVPSVLSSAVSNGALLAKQTLPGGLIRFTWLQQHQVPPYTFGFAVGKFREVNAKGFWSNPKFRVRRTDLRFLARQTFTRQQLQTIFADTRDMQEFFTARAGVSYPDAIYTQVLATGNVAQELGNFTILRESLGKDVLEDPREDYLIAHEFAHQWWGIGLSCADWANFWLNEGMAEFMMMAYREHRFGRGTYDDDIDHARAQYEGIRAAGKDRGLAARTVVREADAGGPIVYDKGALVIHLLRYELGDTAFWRGLKLYTTKYFNASVTTDDLQHALEQASGRDLTDFFAQWVYGSGVPAVEAHYLAGNGVVVVKLDQQAPLRTLSFDVAVESDQGRVRRHVELSTQHQELEFILQGALRSVRIDEGGHLPFRIKQQRPLEMLLYQLAHEPDVAGRADALAVLAQVLRAAQTDSADRVRIRQALAERGLLDTSERMRELAEDAVKPN